MRLFATKQLTGIVQTEDRRGSASEWFLVMPAREFRLILTGAILSSGLMQGSPLQALKGLEGHQALLRLRDGSTVRGSLERVEASAIIVEDQSFACSTIAEASVAKKSRRGLWTAIGAGAGIAAGVALGARFSNEANDSAAALTVVGLTAAGAGAGFLAGGGKTTTTGTIDPAACP